MVFPYRLREMYCCNMTARWPGKIAAGNFIDRCLARSAAFNVFIGEDAEKNRFAAQKQVQDRQTAGEAEINEDTASQGQQEGKQPEGE